MRHSTPSMQSPHMVHRQAPRSAPPSRKNTPLVFEFPSADDNRSVASQSGPSTPRSVGEPSTSGPGNWIERTHHLQNRSDVPQPKRRRTEDGQDAKFGVVMPMRSGSGVLGEYVKDKHKEPNGHSSSSSLTVDLTGSTFKSLHESRLLELELKICVRQR